MGNICFMGTSGYERAYHREYDTTAMSKEIVKNEVLFKQIDQKLQERRKEKTSWDSIFFEVSFLSTTHFPYIFLLNGLFFKIIS